MTKHGTPPRFFLTHALSLIVLALLGTSDATAQDASLHPYEVGVSVEATTYLRILDGSGCEVYPSETCEPIAFGYQQITPSSGNAPEWTADFTNPANCPTCDWQFVWQPGQTELLTFEFSTTNAEMGVFARYVYVPAGEVPSARESFYVPSSSTGSPDIIFSVLDVQGTPQVKARDGGTFFEDVFSEGYVIPYDLAYFRDQTTSTSWEQPGFFLSPVDYAPDSTSGRTFTFAAEGEARAHPTWSPVWDVPDLTLQFPQGQRLIVEGDLTADGVTFTEAGSQSWGGIAVYAGGTLAFDGVTVSDAEVGVDVYSTGNTFDDSFFTGNGVGIRSSYEQSYCPGLEACLIGDRSSFTLAESCVIDSEFNQQLDFEGYGIWARGTDALVTASTVEGNDAYGLRLDDADVAARLMLLTGNGAGNSSFPDGARAASNGDLTLASYFEGSTDRGAVALGLNTIHDNGRHEVSIADDGYATVGLVCSLTSCPDANRVSESGFPGDGDYLIANETKDVIKAHRTYWATSPADPPDAAFLQPTRVEDFQPLTSDPAASAGRPGGCTAPSRPGGSAATTSAALGSEAVRGSGGLDAETAAWLRAQMRDLRQALADAPGADGAAARVRVLYAIQRLDRADALGEHAATSALLVSLYAPLSGDGSVPAPRRATAEAALTATLHDALRHGAYDEARTLLADLGERVEGTEARQALDLVAVALDEQAGDVEGALGRVYALLAELDPEVQLARDLEATAALLEGRLGAGGRAAPARYASEEGPNAALGIGDTEVVLRPAYPNPMTGQALVPVVLAEAAEARVAVYDVLGREVEVLHEGALDAGAHRLRFDGTGLPAGVYLVRAAVTADGATRTFTERLTLLR